MRNSHTTAKTSRLCVSRGEGYHIPYTEQTSVGKAFYTTAQISRNRGKKKPHFHVSRKSIDRPEGSNQDSPAPLCCTADTPRGKTYAVAVHAQVRANRGTTEAPPSRGTSTIQREGDWRVSALTAARWGDANSKRHRINGKQ